MKRFVLAIILVSMVITFSACGSIKNEEISESKTESIQSTNGSKYFVFKSDKEAEYIEFLNNFDENKFEIVHISTFLRPSSYLDDYYMITYKIKD